jgi:hypothetical protein
VAQSNVKPGVVSPLLLGDGAIGFNVPDGDSAKNLARVFYNR